MSFKVWNKTLYKALSVTETQPRQKGKLKDVAFFYYFIIIFVGSGRLAVTKSRYILPILEENFGFSKYFQEKKRLKPTSPEYKRINSCIRG